LLSEPREQLAAKQPRFAPARLPLRCRCLVAFRCITASVISLAFAVRDAHPVTEMHTLMIPKRHVVDYFGLTRPERNSCDTLLRKMKEAIAHDDSNVEGFNVGTNAGEVAGQTVLHAHIHLIPRKRGDVERPRGGVRHAGRLFPD
jgi:diadenosine tetraphosphate (Ap4A) HIT family hydrolase